MKPPFGVRETRVVYDGEDQVVVFACCYPSGSVLYEPRLVGYFNVS